MMARGLRGRLGVAALAAAAVAGGPDLGAQSDDARASALAHLGRNEIVEARTVIEAGLTRRPNDAGPTEALGQLEWRVLHTAAALRAFARVANDRVVGADAAFGLGRIYAFRGWQAEGAFPGWHEEVDQRPLALAAFCRASRLRPTWAAPHVALGEALVLDRQGEAALAEFDAALALAPGDTDALQGRPRALTVLGRGAAAPDTQQIAFAAIDASLEAGQGAAAAAAASAFIAGQPRSTRLVEAYDRLLSAYQVWPDAPAADLTAAIGRRVALRPDPAGYYTGAALLLTRPAMVGRVRALAAAGAAAGERFIDENRSSYKLEGKVQASRDRNRAQAADLVGWAAFLQQDRATAAAKLEEGARLSNGVDFLNQYHRAELARAAGDTAIARERYYDALSLQGGPPPLREAARTQLVALYGADGTLAGDAATAIDRDLERRREQRRLALVGSAIGTSLPPIATTNVAGTPVDLLAERGNVTLLNFFASW